MYGDWSGDTFMRLASGILPGFHGIQYSNSGLQFKETREEFLGKSKGNKGDENKDIGGIEASDIYSYSKYEAQPNS